METKHPKLERSDQIVLSMDNDLSGHGKSYICSFCEKAFSNAQALGGHMNIHRKDRAKLIESSEENMLSSSIVKTINPSDHDQSQVSEVILESREEKSSPSLKRSPYKLSREDDAIEELKQLPLFVERSSPTTSDDFKTRGENKIELDLELRLGPEPHQETSSSKNTREFL